MAGRWYTETELLYENLEWTTRYSVLLTFTVIVILATRLDAGGLSFRETEEKKKKPIATNIWIPAIKYLGPFPII